MFSKDNQPSQEKNGFLAGQKAATNGMNQAALHTQETAPYELSAELQGAAAVTVSSEYKFPPAAFDSPIVAVAKIDALGLPVEESVYLSIGGGVGSFSWVDHLVIHGAKPEDIVSIGFESQPYGRYRRLAENSRIPDHERLRSDSGSTPDNIWGWPGYGIREVGHRFMQGDFGQAGYIAWQMFTEPVFAENFTPLASDVYKSIDQESKRIGWSNIWRYGRVRAIRKTDDGRYVVAYSQSTGTERIHKLMICQYLHIAIGYPGFRYLDDLKEYRERTKDFKRVVNAYDDHEHVYQHLAKKGGTVLVRGRGIVASRVIQNVYEMRAKNPNVGVIHLMRTPKSEGSRYKKAQRSIENHFEFQPYNFPKACFSGDLRELFEEATENERVGLIRVWAGTTTSPRNDWRTLIAQGMGQGWFQQRFGNVLSVNQSDNGKLVTTVQSAGIIKEKAELYADYIIDATGLEADIRNHALIADLLDTYSLPRNKKGGLAVEKSFEIASLRNEKGRVYTCGVVTTGGAFAPVDSFVGLQYAALHSTTSLVQSGAPGLRHLRGLRSIYQWIRWAMGRTP